MPGIHSPMSRHMFTLNGNVRTAGGAKNLAKGQFAIVRSSKVTSQGAAVVSSFAGVPKDEPLELRLGAHKVPNVRTASNSKSAKSEFFDLGSIAKITANTPKVTKQTFDSFIIGYDGINADTAIDLEEGQTTVIDITLSGEAIAFYTGKDQYVLKKHFGREEGETNQEMVHRLVDNFKNDTLPQGVDITDVVSIQVVDSSNDALDGTPYVFSTLVLNDEGDSNALGEVQAQYPEYDVKVTARSGNDTTYTILHPESDSLDDFTSVKPSYIKDCEDCAAGYDLIENGIVYTVSLEDDGTDQTDLVEGLAGAVADSASKKGSKNGFSTYTVVVDDELTDAEITTFVEAGAIQSTAEITKIGDVKAVCYDDTVTSTAWVDGDTCYASEESYKIQLKDDECDGSKLAELQAAYPSLTIEEGSPTGQAVTAVTLTGTSGTANVTVSGVDYLATFNSDLSTTASDFVTAHAADILAATGAVVTADGADIVFTDQGSGGVSPSIANASGNLAGTVGATDFTSTTVEGGCQRVYSTTVITDIVCEECDDIFLDDFTSEAPDSFDFIEWELIPTTADENALMGIRVTGKPITIVPTEATRDSIPFIETSARIKLAGGYSEETAYSFDPNFSDIFNVKRLSRAQDRDALGAYLMSWEDASRYYFHGDHRHMDNLFAKAVLGEESVLEFTEQYVSYNITIHDTRWSQGVGRTSDMGTTYVVWAPFGKHQALEDLVNSLGAAAGLPAVQVSAE